VGQSRPAVRGGAEPAGAGGFGLGNAAETFSTRPGAKPARSESVKEWAVLGKSGEFWRILDF